MLLKLRRFIAPLFSDITWKWCSKCSTRDWGKYCSRCGAKLIAEIEPSVCLNCGHKLYSHGYCRQCGKKVSDARS